MRNSGTAWRRPYAEHAVNDVPGARIERAVPADGRVVVVRARVDDGVAPVVLRQMRIVGRAVERELQHHHARQLEAHRAALGPRR